MRPFVAYFILIAPCLILLGDLALYLMDGYGSTITGIVRDWAEKSPWPEAVFLLGVILLYAHLFRRWP